MSNNKGIEDIELGMLQMQILWVLGSKPTHGYYLMKKLTEIKKKKITQGALYPTLAKLQNLKLIEVKKEGTRGKKIYKLTKKGRKVMIKTCQEFCKTFQGIFKDFVCVGCPKA